MVRSVERTIFVIQSCKNCLNNLVEARDIFGGNLSNLLIPLKI
jgi:hypothetical protein